MTRIPHRVRAGRSTAAGRRPVLFALVSLAALAPLAWPAVASAPEKEAWVQDRPRPSTMGSLLMGLTPKPDWLLSLTRPTPLSVLTAGQPSYSPLTVGGTDLDLTPGAPRFQSETTIAVSGDTVVVAFNDATGFSNPNGVSVTGFAWSHDGGQSFTYGGQLPPAGNDAVFGDPDVKVWVDPATGDKTFVCSSIYQTPSGQNSLCVHVSVDGGMTWSGPREVSAATSSTLFADKEFMDIDPETGRLLLSWTSFGSNSSIMTLSRSDDFGLAWTPAQAFASRPVDGQGSCPRFDPNSDRAYIVWRAFGNPNAVSFVRSSDNGATWTAPADIVTGVQSPLPPYGSDRINGFPALSVSPADGSLHVVYASMQTADFGDVYYLASADSGSTWTAPVILNAAPGSDRCQFFPWVTAAADGGVDATWYDQRSGTAGSDLTEILHSHSEDGGATWSCPTSLLSGPFHAEYGQDTGQPNLGDYSQCASQVVGGIRRLYASYARTDGADYQTAFPDAFVAVNDAGASASMRLTGTSISDIGCTPDSVLVAGEAGDLTLTLANACTVGLTGVSADLSTSTAGVSVSQAHALYPDLAAGASAGNGAPFRVQLDAAYPCGQSVMLHLSGSTDQGPFNLDFELPTGVVVKDTVLVSQDFDGVSSGLPSGWGTTQRKGVSNPWHVTTDLAVSGPNSVFCADYPDTNLSRLYSDPFTVPGDVDLLEVTFEVTYDNEAVGDGRQGFDGALLKIEVDGHDVLAGAFSTTFDGQYRTQIVRSDGSQANPLQDLSAWSGDALPDFESIRIRYPGLAGHSVRLAFEEGCDGNTATVGTYIDDIQVHGLTVGCSDCPATAVPAEEPAAALILGAVHPNPLTAAGEIAFSLPAGGPVWASVFDAAGRRVRTFYDGASLAAGPHHVVWDRRDDRGARVGDGLYFIRVQTPRESRTVKAVVMR